MRKWRTVAALTLFLLACGGGTPTKNKHLGITWYSVTNPGHYWDASSVLAGWAGYARDEYYEIFYNQASFDYDMNQSPNQGGWYSSNLYYPSEAVAYAATNGEFNVGQTVTSNEYCSGANGKSALEQVIADQYRHLTTLNHPLITVTSSDNYTLVTGTQWQELPNGSPQVTGMWIIEPHWGESFVNMVVWREGLTSHSGCYLNVQIASNYFGVYNNEWNEWDAWGGTYYGDENPPECAECPPEALLASPLKSLWVALAHAMPKTLRGSVGRMGEPWAPRQSSGPSVSPGPKRSRGPGIKQVPVYWPRTKRDVIADFVGGVRVTQLARQPGYEILDLADGANIVKDVQYVRSLGSQRSFYLLTIAGVDGTPRALASVDERGWLGAVKLITTADELNPISNERALRLASAAGGIVKEAPVLVAGEGPMFGDWLHPTWQVRTLDGYSYVHPLGAIFLPDKAGTAELRVASDPNTKFRRVE